MHAVAKRLHGVRLQPMDGWPYLYIRRRYSAPLLGKMMEPGLGLTLFLCITVGITYIARLLVNARLRVKMLQACTSKELVEAVLKGDSHHDQMTALRWGILTAAEAIAFGIIQAMGWTDISAGVIAMLLGAFGFGSVLFFVLARRLV